MANPTHFLGASLGASKSFVQNVSGTIASNLQACAFKIRQSPTVQKTVAIVKEIAPTAIAMVGAYYAPARVTFLAVGFAAFLANNKFIKEKRVDRIVGGFALGILLGKGVVATVVTIALIGTAGYYLRTQSARHSAEINEINQKLLEDETKKMIDETEKMIDETEKTITDYLLVNYKSLIDEKERTGNKETLEEERKAWLARL